MVLMKQPKEQRNMNTIGRNITQRDDWEIILFQTRKEKVIVRELMISKNTLSVMQL